MKLFQLSFLLFFAQLAFAQAPAKAKSPAQPALRFNLLEIERQDIPYGSEDMFVFEFKNMSKKPAVITKVQTSCGCTAADRPETPIRKGKKALLKFITTPSELAHLPKPSLFFLTLETLLC